MACLAAVLLLEPAAGQAPAAQPSRAPSVAEEQVREGKKPEPAPEPADSAKTSRRVLRQGGRDIPYTATVGRIVLKDEQGKPRASIFYTAYEAEQADKATRPTTFSFNGGPGAASIWMHLGALGPRIIDLPEDGLLPPASVRLKDNDASWLAFTDLVFIDPVGVGFSRAASKEDEKKFYNVEEDVRSVGEFIRLWLSRQGRWLSPKFVVGASYGTTRAAALAEWLHDGPGVDVNGVILVSPVLDFDTIMGGETGLLPDLLALPTYAATAWSHGRSAEELRQLPLDQVLARAEAFATGEYASLLARGGPADEAQARALAGSVAGLTGLSPAFVEKSGLFVPPGRFRTELLRDQGLVAGRMDTRATGRLLDPIAAESGFDPALDSLTGTVAAAANHYLRVELGYETDLTYEYLSNEVNRAWDWSRSVRGQGFVSVSGDLARAMAVNPRLRTLLACGLFDLATPYFAAEHTVNRMNLPAPLRANLRLRKYAAGHMIYLDRAERARLFQDAAAFVEESAAPRP